MVFSYEGMSCLKFLVNRTGYLLKKHENKKAFTYSASTNVASTSYYIKFSQSRMLCSIIGSLHCLLGRRENTPRGEKDWREGGIVRELEKPLQGGARKESKDIWSV